MARETKLGLVVSCSFLCLLGTVLYVKLTEKEGPKGDVIARAENHSSAPVGGDPNPIKVDVTPAPAEPVKDAPDPAPAPPPTIDPNVMRAAVGGDGKGPEKKAPDPTPAPVFAPSAAGQKEPEATPPAPAPVSAPAPAPAGGNPFSNLVPPPAPPPAGAGEPAQEDPAKIAPPPPHPAAGKINSENARPGFELPKPATADVKPAPAGETGGQSSVGLPGGTRPDGKAEGKDAKPSPQDKQPALPVKSETDPLGSKEPPPPAFPGEPNKPKSGEPEKTTPSPFPAPAGNQDAVPPPAPAPEPLPRGERPGSSGGFTPPPPADPVTLGNQPGLIPYPPKPESAPAAPPDFAPAGAKPGAGGRTPSAPKDFSSVPPIPAAGSTGANATPAPGVGRMNPGEATPPSVPTIPAPVDGAGEATRVTPSPGIGSPGEPGTGAFPPPVPAGTPPASDPKFGATPGAAPTDPGVSIGRPTHPGAGGVRSSGPFPAAGAPSVGAIPTIPASSDNARVVAAAVPQVESYDEETYLCRANESFENISQRFYNSKNYAQALLLFNRNHPRAASALWKDPPALPEGQAVYIPPVRILEKQYGGSIPGLRSAAPATPAPASVKPSVAPPATAAAARPRYIVRQNESIAIIARDTLGNPDRWNEIYQLNNRNFDPSRLLAPGTVLAMPADAKVPRENQP